MPSSIDKISEELSTISISERKFDLRELKIKKCRQLSELVVESHQKLAARLEAMNPESDISALAPLSTEINEEIIHILNFLFGLSGDGAITREWYEDNFSVRELEMIIDEAARQSRMDWLRPFFDRLSQLGILASLKKVGKREYPNGNPIT